MNNRPRPYRSAENEAVKPKLYAIASGKGGVGKSVIAFNLALALSRNFKVLLIDGDFQMGNLHLIGNVSPSHSWQDLCVGRVEFENCVVSISASLDLLSSVGSMHEETLPPVKSLADNLADLRNRAAAYDFIIIDTASGVLPHTTLILNAVDEVVLVTTPELTSISDCYALYKILVSNNERIKASLLTNRENRREEREYIYNKFAAMADRFLGRTPACFGWLGDDSALVDSVAHQRGIFDHAPNSLIANQFAGLARNMSGEREYSRFEPDIINSNPLGADIKE